MGVHVNGLGSISLRKDAIYKVQKSRAGRRTAKTLDRMEREIVEADGAPAGAVPMADYLQCFDTEAWDAEVADMKHRGLDWKAALFALDRQFALIRGKVVIIFSVFDSVGHTIVTLHECRTSPNLDARAFDANPTSRTGAVVVNLTAGGKGRSRPSNRLHAHTADLNPGAAELCAPEIAVVHEAASSMAIPRKSRRPETQMRHVLLAGLLSLTSSASAMGAGSGEALRRYDAREAIEANVAWPGARSAAPVAPRAEPAVASDRWQTFTARPPFGGPHVSVAVAAAPADEMRAIVIDLTCDGLRGCEAKAGPAADVASPGARSAAPVPPRAEPAVTSDRLRPSTERAPFGC